MNPLKNLFDPQNSPEGLKSLGGDRYQETVHTGYGERLLNSIGGALIGFLLFLASFIILYINEGHVAETKASLESLKGDVVLANAMEPTANLQNKLVHMIAPLKPLANLADGVYLNEGPYLALRHQGEMYQWVEKEESRTEKKLGGGTETVKEYSYYKAWRSGREASENFKVPNGHQNPEPSHSPQTLYNESTSFGKLDGRSVLNHVEDWQKLPLSSKTLKKAHLPKVKGSYLYLPIRDAPQIGDERVSFEYIKQDTYSVLAQLASSRELTAYTPKGGKPHFLVERGRMSPNQMIETAKSRADFWAYVGRIAGFIMMFLGLTLMLNPFATVLDIIPFVGSLGRLAISLFAFSVAALLSLATILISYLIHHPLVFLALFVGTLGLVYGMIQVGKNRQKPPSKPAEGLKKSA